MPRQLFMMIYWSVIVYVVYYAIAGLFTGLFLDQYALPKRIIIMRHAERNYDPNIHHDHNLNSQGWQRAILLPIYFKNPPHGLTNLIELPDFIFTPQFFANGKISSFRSYQTVLPLALYLKLPINYTFFRDETMELVREIFSNKNMVGKTVLVSWSHSKIAEIVYNMGGIFAKSWNYDPLSEMNDYLICDMVWIIEPSKINRNMMTMYVIKTYDILMPNITTSEEQDHYFEQMNNLTVRWMLFNTTSQIYFMHEFPINNFKN